MSGTSSSGRLCEKLAFEIGARDSVGGAAVLADKLLQSLRAMEFRIYEPMSSENAVLHMSCGPIPELVKLLNVSVRLLRSLPALIGSPQQTPEAEDLIAEVEHALAPAPVTGTPIPPLDTFCEELDEAIKTLPNAGSRDSFVSEFLTLCGRTVRALEDALELVREARRQQSKWGLITAGEEARRKAQKSLRAATILAMLLVQPDTANGLFPNEISELQTALLVRGMLMNLRRDVLHICDNLDDLGAADLPACLRRIRDRIVDFCANPTYNSVRAPDRFLLHNLQTRVQECLAQVPSRQDLMRAVLQDCRNFADGLRGVNRRAILVRHDGEVQAQVLRSLQSLPQALPDGTHPWGQLSATLREAARMQWRSDRLDRLVQTELQRGPGDSQSIEARARQLAEEVGRVVLGREV